MKRRLRSVCGEAGLLLELSGRVRILYGIAGDGLGHAVRSRVVIEALLREHDVRIVASGHAHEYLAGRFPEADELWSLGSGEAAERGDWETNVPSLAEAVTRWPRDVRDLYATAEAFRPHAVITDCESFVALFAIRHSLPLISIDHIHAIDRCRHDPGLLRGHEAELWRSRNLVGAKVPNATHYVITTFFYPLLLEPRTTLVPPILRPEILEASPEVGDHVLAYLPPGQEPLAAALLATGIPCRIHGLRQSLQEDVVEGSATYRSPSEPTFIDDLRTARAVVAYGAFTLLSEAIYLGKPAFVVPSRGHFGHLLNALYLQKLGYGTYAEELTPAAFEAFLDQLPAYRAAVAGYSQDGNIAALETIDRVLTEAAGRNRAAGTRR
jgi:uncharacterized protein (TIGR00661 family)